jgi:hypothetical protein
MELEAEAKKLVNYVHSLNDNFKITKAEPLKHIGAIITDAVLQVGHRWKTHVGPRVERIENSYPEAGTISGLLSLLRSKGAQDLLNWNGIDAQERFRQTAEFFAREQIETVDDLHKWLQSEDNRDRLVTQSPRDDKAGIAKIANKTADYYRVLVGLPDAVAIDTYIKEFLTKAHIDTRKYKYEELRTIVQLAAKQMGIRPVDLDQSIWNFQSENKEGGEKMDKDNDTKSRLEVVAPDNAGLGIESSTYRCEVEGVMRCQDTKNPESGSWEITIGKKEEYQKLDRFPLTHKDTSQGIGVTLFCGEQRCEASLHRYDKPGRRGVYIGSARRRLRLGPIYTKLWGDFLHKHSLNKLGLKVTLVFKGNKVYVTGMKT